MPDTTGETGEVVAESPSAETHTEAENTPAGENPVQTKNEQKVPYLRFKEVNDKSKSKDARIAELEKKLAERDAVPNDPDGEDEMSKLSKILTEKGVKPEVAEALSSVVKQASKSRYEKEQRKAAERLAQTEKENADRAGRAASDIKAWREKLEKAYPDSAQYSKEMEEQFNSLDREAQMALVASEKGHELLYKAARASKADTAHAEGEAAGRKEAYETQGLKAAVSSKPGATANAGKKWTAEAVAGLSLKEYTENRESIMKDLGIKK